MKEDRMNEEVVLWKKTVVSLGFDPATELDYWWRAKREMGSKKSDRRGANMRWFSSANRGFCGRDR